jgi:hypothetical protein
VVASLLCHLPTLRKGAKDGAPISVGDLEANVGPFTSVAMTKSFVIFAGEAERSKRRFFGFAQDDNSVGGETHISEARCGHPAHGFVAICCCGISG